MPSHPTAGTANAADTLTNAQYGWYSQPGKNGLIAGALDGRPLAATPDSPRHLLPRPANRRRLALLLTLAAHLLLASLYFAYRGALPLPPLLRADTPQARFGAAAAGPWIDRARTTTIDQYRSPEGVIIERINRGGGSSCYMRGVVNFAPGILHDSGRPSAVACPPSGSGWSRK